MNDLEGIEAMSAGLHELLDASAATEIWGTEYNPGVSSHDLGTCGTGNDTATSVVDWCGRTHDVGQPVHRRQQRVRHRRCREPVIHILALALRTSEAIVATVLAAHQEL